MAALAPVSLPVRRPFARLDGTRLRNLTNIKNRQNANIPVLSPSKRPYPSEEPFSQDSENVDPNLNSPLKKAKTVDSIPFYSTKPSRFVFKHADTAQINGTKPGCLPASGPKNVSALSPAGRSPRSKRAGILCRRRVSSSPFAGAAPLTFELNSNGSSGLPFSIDAALSGTVRSYVPNLATLEASTLDEKIPRSWLFDIHEDTPEEELGNLVQFSTQTLDISDDEGKAQDHDHRGKENVPPSEVLASGNNHVALISRKDLMTEETRAPLSELNSLDFFVEEHDRNSSPLPEELSPKDHENLLPTADTISKDNATMSPPVESLTGNQDAWKEILAQVDSTCKSIANYSSSGVSGLASQHVLDRHVADMQGSEIARRSYKELRVS